MRLEHVNVTVPNARATAAILCEIFGWKVRWEGAAIDDGYSVHVGTEDSYLAVYSPARDLIGQASRYDRVGALNHIGIVVPDLAVTEARVKAAGYTPYSHANYEPGERFYFDGPDGVEYEVVSYT